jgi:hypothetical protein
LDENLQREFTIFEAAPQVRILFILVFFFELDEANDSDWLREASSANEDKAFCECRKSGKS